MGSGWEAGRGAYGLAVQEGPLDGMAWGPAASEHGGSERTSGGPNRALERAAAAHGIGVNVGPSGSAASTGGSFPESSLPNVRVSVPTC